MARKVNPISVRLDLNRSSDQVGSVRATAKVTEGVSLFLHPRFKKKAGKGVADVRDGHDFF